MKICVAGQGAFGQKHLDALKRIPGVEVTSLVGGSAALPPSPAPGGDLDPGAPTAPLAR